MMGNIYTDVNFPKCYITFGKGNIRIYIAHLLMGTVFWGVRVSARRATHLHLVMRPFRNALKTMPIRKWAIYLRMLPFPNVLGKLSSVNIVPIF